MINPDSRVTIHPGGYVTVDVLVWLDQRTGGPIDELTTALQNWASRPDAAPDWLENAQTWMTTSGFEPTSPELAVTDVIAHVETRLDAEVWILRGIHRDWGPVAVVGINHDPATVYADACTDSGDWFDADSVDITCPGGHGWTWQERPRPHHRGRVVRHPHRSVRSQCGCPVQAVPALPRLHRRLSLEAVRLRRHPLDHLPDLRPPLRPPPAHSITSSPRPWGSRPRRLNPSLSRLPQVRAHPAHALTRCPAAGRA
ncbi:hypothetical protein [Kineosporia sp. R_H_3]|uniref:hypothetical protein n=1 Tax=Kineosporia sp. R_H_3 TaxID=1961848 RepID=UPI00117ADC30|nr:hypothetical protein [Kineosporia sp. R_H_3]